MPSTLAIDDHAAAIAAAGGLLVDHAAQAGMTASVPTCPQWTAARLLAHVAMVHRWATAHVRGDDPDAVPDQTTILAEVHDLPSFVAEGQRALLAALRDAPDDLEAMTFLNDAGAPRAFWARRQAHETTIHMADALGALLGRCPTAAEVGVETELAVDGVEELLRGFFTRGRSELHDGEAYAVLVAATDTDRTWLLHVAEELTVDDAGSGTAAISMTGTAAQLYLGLWNRGDEIEVTGSTDVLERWRATQRVRWS